MRSVRLMLYFFVGLLLGVVSVMSYAETIAATPAGLSPLKWRKTTLTTPLFDTAALACQDWISTSYPGWSSSVTIVDWSSYTCKRSKDGSTISQGSVNAYCPVGTTSASGCTGTTAYTCPAGQNWTLSGSSCTRPDCGQGETRDPATGLCAVPQCAAAANAELGSYTVSYPIQSGFWCVNHCQAYASDSRNRVGDRVIVDMYVNGAGGAASNCDSSQVEPTPTVEPDDLEPPPCPPGSGSYLSQGGVVMCTSPTTPNATVPPIVKKDTEKKTFPDGSEKTTTITKTCTGDGACTTTTITNVTGAGGGTTPGEAGNPGTTTGTGTSTGTGGGGTDDDGDATPSISTGELGEVPELYEPKYPEGLKGVWNNNIAAIKSTPLFSLPQVFAPTNINAGQCPTWSFDANIGPHMAFGSGGFAPPCYVWDFIKVVVIISALMLARALIFGG